MALFSIAGLFVVTPVVAFYMLLDWDRMVAKVDSWVPRDHVETVRTIATDINTATAGFVRGQGTLCLMLGVMYAIGLTLTGLNFGILIGLFAGLISFIPYVGSLVGLVLSVGVAFVQFWPDWLMVAAVAGVFFIGQFIEGNILQPRLVGKSVGLHPVWLMFALFAFGALFGFVGLLIAVPAAAAVAVLVRFAHRPLSRIAALYGGAEPPPDAAVDIVVADAQGAGPAFGQVDIDRHASQTAHGRLPLDLGHGPGHSRDDLVVSERQPPGGRADRPLAGLAGAGGGARRSRRLRQSRIWRRSGRRRQTPYRWMRTDIEGWVRRLAADDTASSIDDADSGARRARPLPPDQRCARRPAPTSC